MVFARSALRLARPASSLLQQRCTVPFTQRGASLGKTAGLGGVRTLTASSSRQGKVLLVLYDVSGFIHYIDGASRLTVRAVGQGACRPRTPSARDNGERARDQEMA